MIHMIDCPEPVLANDHVSSRNDIVFEREVFSLCLSRACLGKKIALLYIYIYGAKSPFSHLARPKVNLPSAVAVRETLPKPLNHRTHLPSIILFAQARGIAFKTTHCDAVAIRK
jgi:hypothetical protein